jgi:hypothetical protein
MSIIWEPGLSAETKVPVPIGFISIAFYLAYSFSLSTIGTKYSFIMSKKKILILLTLTGLTFFWLISISNLALERSLQLILPTLLIGMIATPKKQSDIYLIILYLNLSSGIFLSTHLLHIFLTAKEFINPNKLEFVNLFTGSIYQGLVSYPSVIFIYFCLFSYSAIGLKKNVAFNTILSIISLILLAMASRKSSLISIFIFLSIPILYLIYYTVINFEIKKNIISILIRFSTLILAVVLIFGLDLPIINRLQSQLDDGIASSRTDKWSAALNLFTSDINLFLFGSGGFAPPGLHNYILDTLYRVGLFGLVLIFFILGYAAKGTTQGIKRTHGKFTTVTKIFLLILFGEIFVQSTFNSGLTQPYFFVNLLYVIIFISLCKPVEKSRYKYNSHQTTDIIHSSPYVFNHKGFMPPTQRNT